MVRDYNLNKLRISSDLTAIGRAQGAYEIAQTIVDMKDFLSEHIKNLEKIAKQKEGAQHGVGT
jgi:signal transduction histidine kinase